MSDFDDLFQADSIPAEPKKTFRSLSAIGKFFSVNAPNVRKTREKFGDAFPRKHVDGYHFDEVDSFARENQIWKYSTHASRENGRKSNGNNGRNRGDESGDESHLAAKVPSRVQKEIEYKDRQIRAKDFEFEKCQVDRARELGKLLLADDVFHFYEQSVSLVVSLLDSLHDLHDRELPDKCPELDFWPQVRARILAADKKLLEDVSNAMGELPT